MTGIRVRPGVKWAPGARKTSGNFRGDGPPKALLHATIAPSMTLPDYHNQAWAPHETLLWDRVKKQIHPVTHYYFDQYAKALQDLPGGPLTNNDMVRQWELAGYLGKETPKGQFDILEAPNVYWEAVADCIGPIVISWNIQNKFSRSFGAGISEANKAKRMSGSEWDSFSGFCTHADVPENSHWDSPLGARVRLILQDKIWPTVITPPVNPRPPITISEVDVPRIVQVRDPKSKALLDPQYVTNGVNYYWLSSGTAKSNALKAWGSALNSTPVEVPSLTGLGVPVGPMPPA